MTWTPYPPRASTRRRRTGLWVGLGVGAFVVVLIAGAAADLSIKDSISRSALGPSACVPSGNLTEGAGPWRMVLPKTLCGLPRDDSAQDKQSGQENLSVEEDVFDTLYGQPSIGHYTAGFVADWETPGGTGGVYRDVGIIGFDGSFPSPQAAVAAVAKLDSNPDLGYVFSRVNPGPHGGAMECAVEGPTSEECVFATTTTLGDITIVDTSKELTGSHSNTTAIDIRDALEVKR